jgi:hypothetical protein
MIQFQHGSTYNKALCFWFQARTLLCETFRPVGLRQTTCMITDISLKLKREVHTNLILDVKFTDFLFPARESESRLLLSSSISDVYIQSMMGPTSISYRFLETNHESESYLSIKLSSLCPVILSPTNAPRTPTSVQSPHLVRTSLDRLA